ncbi:hypothetical protein ACN38_g9427 [Penicillium nordicum]|uniref:Uncharacterized protein n=1 Tax=Penicillium nordicum TaxID=229535 RepID=A0A0M8P360_9EURO|nr:hypothetical protein ACN38_g9427 [Penicillium nordicum]
MAVSPFVWGSKASFLWINGAHAELVTVHYGKRTRPHDTVEPLAKNLGLTVDTSCGRDDSDCVKDVVDGYDGKGLV